MLRGRHRGLPVAIDRAVMLPNEFEKEDEDLPGDNPFTGSEDSEGQTFTQPQSPSLTKHNPSDIRQRVSRRMSTRLSPTQEKEYQSDKENNFDDEHP